MMCSDKLIYKVYIWVLFGIILGKEKEALSIGLCYVGTGGTNRAVTGSVEPVAIWPQVSAEWVQWGHHWAGGADS